MQNIHTKVKGNFKIGLKHLFLKASRENDFGTQWQTKVSHLLHAQINVELHPGSCARKPKK